MHELTLDSLCFGGDAVGRIDGKVVFVPRGAPGDRVRVRIVEQRKRFARAELLEVIEGGPSRQQAPCPHYADCGGCQWQHVSYDEQLRAKARLVGDALRGKAPTPSAIAAAPETFGYRRRVRMHWRVEGGRVTLGYHRRGSRRLVDIDRCPLLCAPLQRALDVCRQRLEEGGSDHGSLALLHGTGDEVHLSLRLEGGRLPDPQRFLVPPIVGGVVEQRGSRGSFGQPWIKLESPAGAPLWAAATAFTQANARQDELLRGLVGQWAASPGRRVLELFAGIGNLTRVLAAEAETVTAVESAAAACELLRRNVATTSCPVEVVEQDAAAFVGGAGADYHTVVLDPPREGCLEVVRALPALSPARVVYISCDPMTLQRDLDVLGAAGYRATRSWGQDMMPQTYHVELVVALERAPSRPERSG